MIGELLFTSVSGWMTATLTLFTTVLPYVLRRSNRKSIRQLGPFLSRMRPHYWIGYSVLVLALVHTVVSMSASVLHGANPIGLYWATGALLLLIWQVWLGRSLTQPIRDRGRLNCLHFWLTISICILGAGHVVLNSSLVQILFR